MDPVKIPQNVSIEDRIIGPVTLRQLIVCLIGGGISYALWSSLQASGIRGGEAWFAWIPLGIAILFSFVRINDISLLRMCILLIERMVEPQRQVWAPRTGVTIHFRTAAMSEKEEQKNGKRKTEGQQPSFEELSSVLDRDFPGGEEGHRIAIDAPAPEDDVLRDVRRPAQPATGSELLRDILPPPAHE